MLTLQENSLDWALNHALKYGDTDVFPVPFEYDAIQHDWGNLKSFLKEQNVLEWKTRQHRVLLAPKASYGFRIVTQLDPLDFLIFASLVYEIGADLESKRVPISRKTVFSYRYSPDPQGRLFAPDTGYSGFIQESRTIIDGGGITHVAIADIADFYQRIYHHPLENALTNASDKISHVKSIMRLLSGWNNTETYGIPVGEAPSRLLAEITISDIDHALLGYGIQFVRFNDDYRLFARSEVEGYRYLAILADVLYKNHGLTLQTQKTKIVNIKKFRNRFVPTPDDITLDTLNEKFHELIDELGLSDPYEEIAYDDLEDDQKEIVDSLNLREMFAEETRKGSNLDLGIVSFVLKRMSQLGDASLVKQISQNLDVLYPVFPDVIRYFSKLRYLSTKERQKIGKQVLSLLQRSKISELEYYNMWSLELFTHSTEWNNEEQLLLLINSPSNLASRRKLILALGRASKEHWFSSRKRELFNEPFWTRRALIAGASCMPNDARRHWYNSIESKLDPLEKAVMRWARQNPFGQS